MLQSVKHVQELDVNSSGFITNKEALLNKISNLFKVPKYSFPFKREFELDLERYLHRSFNIITANIIQVEIENSLYKYFPGIKIEQFEVNLEYTARTYEISIFINHPVLNETELIKTSYQSHV